MNGVDTVDKVFLLGLTRDIVTAYITHNALNSGDLPALINEVYAALEEAPMSDADVAEPVNLVPAVAIGDSVTEDHIICLEDGLSFKSLKRHIRSKYKMTPEAYREKWQLPDDYPMVAPNYAKERSRIAKKTGLGRKQNQL